MTKDDSASAAESGPISATRFSPEEKPPEERKLEKLQPGHHLECHRLECHRIEAAYQSVLNYQPLTTVEYLFPDIIQIIDKTIDPRFISNDLYDMARKMNPDFVNHDFTYQFGSLDSKFSSIIISIKQQEENDHLLPGKLLETHVNLLENYPDAGIITCVLASGYEQKFNKIVRSCLQSSIEFSFRVYNVTETNEKTLINDTHPFAFIILAALYKSKAKENQRKLEQYFLKLHKLLSKATHIDSGAREVYSEFVHKIFGINYLKTSNTFHWESLATVINPAQQFRYDLKAKIEAEVKAKIMAEVKAEFEAEVKAKNLAELMAKIAAEGKAKVKAKIEAEAKAEIEVAEIDTAEIDAAEAKAEVEAKVQAKIETKIEAERKDFMDILPRYFEWFGGAPFLLPAVLIQGATYGVDQQTIEGVYYKWLKAEKGGS
jgi:hypothetical protein